ncbi:DinB family protein [Streptomyces sp. ODS05-4]|uniref:DinB family protein n=1 Tax=Streptomyces sp. ODS05-4 TaxID=2944939 RepID=UPI0021094274|nr:DinB family protein [Streptomyces sp. ODS05-4]
MTDATTPATGTPLDGERTDLLDALAAARAALVNTVRGLTDEQAGQSPTVSSLCLGGLVKHVTRVEDRWLTFATEGGKNIDYALPAGVTWADITSGTAREYPQWMIEHQAAFRMAPGETLAEVLRRYEETAARTAGIVAALPDLSASHTLPEAPWEEEHGGSWTVRRVLMHVIEETSQHAGHADILREALDGSTAT